MTEALVKVPSIGHEGCSEEHISTDGAHLVPESLAPCVPTFPLRSQAGQEGFASVHLQGPVYQHDIVQCNLQRALLLTDTNYPIMSNTAYTLHHYIANSLLNSLQKVKHKIQARENQHNNFRDHSCSAIILECTVHVMPPWQNMYAKTNTLNIPTSSHIRDHKVLSYVCTPRGVHTLASTVTRSALMVLTWLMSTAYSSLYLPMEVSNA